MALGKVCAALQITILAFVCLITHLVNAAENDKLAVCNNTSWSLIESNLKARHESAAISTNEHIYLLGGRGMKPTERFAIGGKKWEKVAVNLPMELHHFQPAFLNDKIYIMGAFTGPWPNETPVDHIIYFDIESQTYGKSVQIPSDRQRGAAGVVEYKKKLYMVGGITNGHMSGSVKWFDEYDPNTHTFKKLPDAPIARDHFYAAIVKDKLYVIGGRKSSRATGNDFDLTIKEVDVFDFNTQQWQTLPASQNLPTPRAGANVVAVNNEVWIIGGESASQNKAHKEVEIFDTRSNLWRDGPQLELGRHSGGAVKLNNRVYVISGSGNRGGSPELQNVEVIDVHTSCNDQTSSAQKNTSPSSLQVGVMDAPLALFQTVDFDIVGPELGEKSQTNPFTEYVMWTHVLHESGQSWHVRGYFAGDGKAAFSSAESGRIWRSKFTPPITGSYEFVSAFYKGALGAIKSHKFAQRNLTLLKRNTGKFLVEGVKKEATGFDRLGFLSIKNGYFYLPYTKQYWLKTGNNSPENFLAYHEFDGTTRIGEQTRTGESNVGINLHQYLSHIQDFETNNPLWGDGTKGKAIIGAINYLAQAGVNSQYFLTMNIKGDGRDVWPYVNHKTLDRFDISKLDQWDILFTHMQQKGIQLHIVTQETENETFLDNGETGNLRKLYYAELIARFAHHKALVWNMGEENGPEPWTPIAQNDQQRVDMAAFIAQQDPYQHPVIIHTHSSAQSKHKILPPLYASAYDGVSFQVDDRNRVYDEIKVWRALSKQHRSNKAWLITMDEIGRWYTGALTDQLDPGHISLRRHVLWPTFLAGGAGVEWYAGALQTQNDLGTEDFRIRDELFSISKIARLFLSEQVQIWTLQPIDVEYDTTLTIQGHQTQATVTLPATSLYAAKNHSTYVAYAIERAEVEVNMPAGRYNLTWINPLNGAVVMKKIIDLTKQNEAIATPSKQDKLAADWVLLLKKKA